MHALQGSLFDQGDEIRFAPAWLRSVRSWARAPGWTTCRAG